MPATLWLAMKSRLEGGWRLTVADAVNMVATPFMTRFLTIIASASLLTGCLPLQQSRVVGGRGYDHFGPFDDQGYALLQIGPSNTPKRVHVIDSDSYGLAPDGSRYGIHTEPHPYDIETKTSKVPYVRDRVYLIDPRGHRVTGRWKNGQWKFHFTLRTPNGIETRDFHASFWPFLYIPIIDGPPN